VSQPAGPHSVKLTIGRIDDATDRLLASASALSDEQVGEPSLLPGWSRGHVLTHIARNADGLANLLTWAQTGVETPQYASLGDREAQIEAGAGRSADELTADISRSASEFTARARELADEAWLTEVRASRGPAHPAWFTLHRRLFEVEIHHADLAAGYQPADWPDWFVAGELYRIASDLAVTPATPTAVLNDASSGRQYFLRPDVTADLEISGPGHALLAWLLGRDGGTVLSADPAGPLPDIPSYG
jgi:maleylpyruvate isomerase